MQTCLHVVHNSYVHLIDLFVVCQLKRKRGLVNRGDRTDIQW